MSAIVAGLLLTYGTAMVSVVVAGVAVLASSIIGGRA